MPNTFFWHDYETFGVDPRRDRPVQFAGLRTDSELNPVGEPISILCRPSDDYLPDPGSCLITGISPEMARDKGMAEREFAVRIFDEMSVAQTCSVGFNSLRFDDEVSRFLFHRNYLPPYTREYEGGNSRWDLIDALRMAFALRPDGIQWPHRDDGVPSFRLEDLSAANRIEHTNAHDALADVHATIGMARIFRAAQPRLFEWCLGQRDKARVRNQLNVFEPDILLHTSARFAADRGCTAPVMPLASLAEQNNAVVVFDLTSDPSVLFDLDAAAIAERVFTAKADLASPEDRIPLKIVRINKSPMLAPWKTLRAENADRLGIDVAAVEQHAAKLRHLAGKPELSARLNDVFASRRDHQDCPAEEALYSGPFMTAADRAACDEVRAASPDQVDQLADRFDHPDLADMLWRYGARNRSDFGADSVGQRRWYQYCRECLFGGESQPSRFDWVSGEIANLRSQGGSTTMLDSIERYIHEVKERISSP